MKLSLQKTLLVAALVAAGAGALSLGAAAVNTSPAKADAAESVSSLQGTMVSSKQTDALGREVTLDILQLPEGGYALADAERNISIYNMHNNTSVDLKQLYTSDTGVFDDPYAVSAYETVVRAYDFYADESNLGVSIEGIAGKDGQAPIEVLLHYGYAISNASYNFDENSGTAYFRIGDGSAYGSLFRTAAAADVLAHEYQHAITDRVGGLVYLNESGAISEAISDIMGALIEGHELTEKEFWLTGEDAAPAGKDPMRSAIIPGSGYRLNATNLYPRCDRDHTHETCDNGGVHYNSTVLTHMQYNLWRKLPDYFTRRCIGQLWYATLCKLTPNATLKEFATCFKGAAEELQFSSDALSAIDSSLFECGITAEGNFHMVTFYQYLYDGTLRNVAVDELCIKDGESAPVPADPESFMTESEIYTFARWPELYKNVTRDWVLVRADYSTVKRVFTVRFEDENGNFLSEKDYFYGESATPPELQLKEENETYSYPFLGWSHDLGFVTESFTARPIYGRELKLYRVNLLSEEKQFGYLLVRYDTALDLPDLTGETRALGEEFAGWYLDEECTRPAENIKVTNEITLYAKWVEKEESAPPSPPVNIVVPIVCVCAVLLGGFLVWIVIKQIVSKKKKK